MNARLRARRGARLTAVTNAGVIPDQFDYDVVLNPEGLRIGSIGEDFAFESMPGDIFQLGNTSYKVQKVEVNKVFVEDARGQAPTIPFWFGEAPARSDELSAAVSRLREDALERLDGEPEALERWLGEDIGLDPVAAQQLANYFDDVQARARHAADARHRRVRALLRRRGRYAPRHPLDLRLARQPGLGPGAAQALLPPVQL